jgi:hypothetical protein
MRRIVEYPVGVVLVFAHLLRIALSTAKEDSFAG